MTSRRILAHGGVVGLTLILALAVTVPAGALDRASVEERLEGFDDTVAAAVDAWNVPGLAIAIVSEGEVVLARGFGYRDIANGKPMTADTLFAIGSTTKAMTCTLLGLLVDEGKLAWNEPVTSYLPGFRLSDPRVSERLTPIDLVTHRSGLPRHDALWYNNHEATRAELVTRLAHLELSADLRERYQYNNLLYMTAGHLVEVLTGEAWERNMEKRLFAPLGMERSNLSVEASQRDADFALPYRQDDANEPEPIPFRDIDLIGPAGSVNSSVNEMAKWLLFNLSDGRVGERQLIRPATLETIHSPHMTIEGRPPRADISSGTYGLGWRIDTYRGHRRLSHGGGIDGFITSVMFFPDDDLGLVSFVNTMAGLGQLVNQTAADRILGLEAVDWSGEALARAEKARSATAAAKSGKEAQRRSGTSPSHTLDEYAGAFEHPGYGTLRVRLENGALHVAYNGIEAPLEHWHFDVWNGTEAGSETSWEDQKFLFSSDVNGNIASVTTLMEPRVAPIVFTRQPDPRLRDPAYLTRFEGRYRGEISEEIMTVELSGGTLWAVIGAARYALDPDIDGRFVLREARLVRIGFEEDAAGRVVKAIQYQPDGAYEAVRID